MNRRHFLAFCIAGFMFPAVILNAQYIPVADNPYGERPVLVPVPATVTGVKEVEQDISSGWYSAENPPQDFYKADAIKSPFTAYTSAANTGSTSASTTAADVIGYLREVTVPARFAGKSIILRFSAAMHETSLWVNGQFVKRHWGLRSSAWSADITDFVKPGEKAIIALKFEKTGGIGDFSTFTGRLTGNVSLFAAPSNYIQRARFTTDFDTAYKDATLQLWIKMSGQEKGIVKISATDMKGKKLSISPSSIKLPEGMDEFKYDFKVKSPMKWDAEHPNLYDITLTLTDASGKVTGTLVTPYGFRELETREDQIFVNGREVKFRGMVGGTPKVAKELNVNHLRGGGQLDSCDIYGLYTLDMIGITFVKFGAEEDPQFKHQWQSLISDLIEKDYNHPSIVNWGLGNESFNGENVVNAFKYCKQEDPHRLVMFTWANRVRDDQELPYDIYCNHYPTMGDPDYNLAGYDRAIWHSSSLVKDRPGMSRMPVLVDEANHICIAEEEQIRDPNVRNFWGESIKDAWDRYWNTKGTVGVDQFGLYKYLANDTPEKWLMRKAYSPVVIPERIYDNPGTGNPLIIGIENRFNHTFLSEVTVNWKVGDVSGSFRGPGIEPMAKGVLTIPYKDFKDGDIVELAFTDSYGRQFDEYRLEVNPEPFKLPAVSTFPPVLEEISRGFIIKGKDFEIFYDKYAGQIKSAKYKGETVLTGGPHLQLMRSGIDVAEYWPQSSKVYMDGNEAVIDMDVIYSPISAAFQVRIDGNGLITVHYTVKHTPDAPPAVKTIPWNLADIGGYSEVGIKFTLPASVDRMQWDRRGLWSVYPEDHIGREHGTAYKVSTVKDPVKWKDMDHDYYWFDPHWSISQTERTETTNNDFRSSKEYIRTADVLIKGKTLGVEALSEEKDAVRLEVNGNTGEVTMIINNEWNYPTLGIGNYMKQPIVFGDGYTNTIHIRLIDINE